MTTQQLTILKHSILRHLRTLKVEKSIGTVYLVVLVVQLREFISVPHQVLHSLRLHLMLL